MPKPRTVRTTTTQTFNDIRSFYLKNVEREYSNPHGYGDYVA